MHTLQLCVDASHHQAAGYSSAMRARVPRTLARSVASVMPSHRSPYSNTSSGSTPSLGALARNMLLCQATDVGCNITVYKATATRPSSREALNREVPNDCSYMFSISTMLFAGSWLNFLMTPGSHLLANSQSRTPDLSASKISWHTQAHTGQEARTSCAGFITYLAFGWLARHRR